MDFLFYLAKIIVCAFEVYMVTDLFSFVFEAKTNSRRKKLIVAVLLGLLIFSINYFEFPLLNFFGGIMLTIAYCKIIFDTNTVSALIVTAFFYIINVCSEVLGAFVYSIIYHESSHIEAEFSYQFCLIIIIDKIMVFAILKAIQYFSRKNRNEPIREMLGGFFILPLSTLSLLYGIIKFDFIEDMLIVQRIVLGCGSAMLLFANIFVYHLIERFSTVMIQKREQDIDFAKAAVERKHYEALEKVNKDHLKYIHDINIILGTVSSLIQNDEGSKALELLEKHHNGLRVIQKKLYCNDSILNGLLEDRISNAMAQKIDVLVDIDKTINFHFIDDIDKISMIGNILDNAIEAAARCENDKKIIIRMFMGSPNYLVIMVQNTYHEVPVVFEGDFLTSKDDKQKHGIGIKRIKELTEKYGGMFSTATEGEMFFVNLCLSCIEL